MKTPQKTTPRSRWSLLALGGVSAVVAWHIAMTSVYDFPDQQIKYEALPGRLSDAYMGPVFMQGYKIFAPNPVDFDRQLWFRAWVEQPNGEMLTTEWVNATEAETHETHRRILRKHLTVIAAENLTTAYLKLTPEQIEVVDANFHLDSSLDGLSEELRQAGVSDANRRLFIQVSEYATAYATQGALALWGENGLRSQNHVMAVQVRAVADPVIRWEDRDDPDAERPAATVTQLGWRPLLLSPDQDQEAFARTFTRWMKELDE